MEDNILIEKIKRGDQKALESLFLLYKDKVYNTILSYLQNIEDTEEVLQDVFTEVFFSASKFKGKSSLNTWLYRITVNKSLDWLRHKRRKKRFASFISIFNRNTGSLEIDKPDFYHPGIETELKEQSALLFKALDTLTKNQKTTFILSKIEGLSNKEISKILNVSVSSVESLMVRAKRNLKEYLSDKIEELL